MLKNDMQTTPGVVQNSGSCVKFFVGGRKQDKLSMVFGNDPAAL